MPIRFFTSGAPSTRLGRLLLAGEVIDDEPMVPGPWRVMSQYVLSVVFRGAGSFVHRDGRAEPIRPGTMTVVRPGKAHWYGTAPGERWTELFAVFDGPLFDTLAGTGVIPESGPHQCPVRPRPGTLRAVLSSQPSTPRAVEHQLLALADWLIETGPVPDEPDRLSPAIAAAAGLLGQQLHAPVDLHDIAARVGLPYDTFRRRFKAETGVSPLAFRNARRLDSAATLLRLTDRTTREIARVLGYADEFHLSRRFRAHFGVPPSTYRSYR